MYHGGKAQRKTNPRQKANIFSVITFFFTFDFLWKGYKKDISENDIYEVLPNFKASRVGDTLEYEWSKETKKPKPSIYRLLWSCYGWYYLFLGMVQLVVKIAIILVLPTAQGKLISYFKPKSQLLKSDAVYYASIMITGKILLALYNHNYRFLITELGIKIKTAFCSLLYRKSLRLTSTSLSKNNIGKIVTLISKDVNTFEDFIIFLNDVWISFILFVVASYLLYSKIGVAALSVIGLIVLVIPLQLFLGKLTSHLRIKAARATDERLQISQESLSYIKHIKMNTWEDFFKSKILEARKKEMRTLKQFYFAKSTFIEFGTFLLTLAWYVTVTTYTQLGNTLSAEVVFFIRDVLHNLRSPITISIPLGILRMSELVAAVSRINEVLSAKEEEECDRDNVSSPLIHMENNNIEVDDNVVLQNITININSGLSIITGKVGTGKTTLLKALLDSSNGSVSYASQEPWLFPSSIKQNILFGEKFDKERYQKVLKVCALNTDINSFKQGDETIIDDRGRNLSKGQQVRINLARAVYRDSDIYLIDECLSSLDVHLQEFVFKHCIKGFLKNKIVVIVSQNKTLSKEANNVILVENGSIRRLNTTETVTDEIDNLISVDDESKVIRNETYQNIYHETPKEGKVNFSVYKKYCEYGGGILMLIWILVLYGVTQTGINFTDKSVTKWVNIEEKISLYNDTTTSSSSYQELLKKDEQALRFYTLWIVASVVFLALRMYAYFTFVAKAALAFHKSLVTAVLNATMKFFDLRYFGNILNRFAKDIYTIDELLPFNIHECLKFICIFISTMEMIISVNAYFLIPAAIFLVVLFLTRMFYIPTGRSLKRLDSATRSPVIGHLNASLEGLPTIRACGNENILIGEFDRHQDLHTSTVYMYQSSSRLFALVLDMLCNFFVTAIIVRFLIAEKDTEAGNVGQAISQALGLTGLLQFGIRQWAELESHLTAAERVLEYTNVETENKKDYLTKNFQSLGKITYRNVNLTYGKSKDYVLKNIDLVITPGEKIGIVGRTGSGKTSLISILFRLYDYKGEICIDDIDIKTLSLNQLRSSFVIIPQDPVVFNGTVRSNIDPLENFSDHDIWQAINTAHLTKLIPSLDYQITENGANFSTGQKQIICLVRALINKKKIIILDEATANVDPETDIQISQMIRDNFDDCTVLMIAHRLQRVVGSDRVMVLSNGEIVECDKPDVLLEKRDGMFFNMMKKAKLF